MLKRQENRNLIFPQTEKGDDRIVLERRSNFCAFQAFTKLNHA